MKKIIKSFIITIFVVIVIGICPDIVNAVAYRPFESYMINQSDGMGIFPANAWMSETFQAESSHKVDKIYFIAKKEGSPTYNLTVSLNTVDNSSPKKPTDTVLGSGTWLTSNGSSSYAIYSVTLGTEVSVVAGTWYAVVWGSTAGGGGDYIRVGLDLAGSVYPGYAWISTNSGTSWTQETSDWDMNFAVYGVATATVITMEPVGVYPAKVKLPGLVTYLGEDVQVHAYIQYGMMTGVYDFTLDCGVVKSAGLYGYFSGVISNPLPGVTYYYRARIDGSVCGSVYGDEIGFVQGLANATEVHTDQVANVGFTEAEMGAFLVDMGGEAEVELSIDIGLTGSYGTNAVIDAACVAPEDMKVKITGLTSGTVYHYRAKAVGESETYYGEDRSFQTKNSGQPDIISRITVWLGQNGWAGEGVWWLFLAALIGLVWILLHDTKLKQVGAAVLSVIFMGAFVMLKLIDIWLVVLLAILAGVVIYTIVFRSHGD